MGSYMNWYDQNDTKPLTKAEELELSRKIHAGIHSAFDEFIMRNQRLVYRIAHRYEWGADFDDLVQGGNIGLVKAVRQFDGERGVPFVVFGAYFIHGEVIRTLNETLHPIKLPTNLVKEIGKIERRRREMELELGRMPTDDEVAVDLGYEIANFYEIDGIPRIVRSYDTILETEEGTGRFVSDTMASDEEEEYIETTILAERLVDILDDLPVRYRLVLKLRSGLGNREPRTLHETAELLGVSYEWVRQIANEGISMAQKYSLVSIQRV